MKLIFNIDYKTVYGEELVLNVVESAHAAERQTVKYRMSTLDGQRWTYEMMVPTKARGSVLDYYYSVDCEGNERRHEWLTEMHRVELNAVKGLCYEQYDRWNDIPEDSYLYSAAFTECVNGRRVNLPNGQEYARTVRLKVRAPQLHAGERLALVGADDYLGRWDVHKALAMTEHNYNEWTIDVNADAFARREVEFKFVALRDDHNDYAEWETGLNRTLLLPKMSDGDVCCYELEQAFFAYFNTRLAGTLVPVFSLRTKGSFGIGDFGDLQRMIDFMATTGQRVLQVLPINDTTTTHTWTDSYPYSCISIFALHPQYCDLRQLPELKDAEQRSRFAQLQVELNALPQIDYERVNDMKMEYLRLLYAQEGADVMASAAYRSFFKQTEQWLVPYAQYCYLRDTYGTADFTQWPDHRTWDEKERKQLSTARTKAYGQVAFYYFVQYILNTQMAAAHDYAREKHVVLKGDIPIGVSRYGCDVWMEPGYFNMNGQAGAPPDDFSVEGQNWGFPTYNWEAMIKDGCRWWVRRFQNMAKFFDAYRIDHVLGFFRIWEIPIHSVHGLLGQFAPALAMSREEIEAYGLHFQEELFTKPFIADWVLDRVFHEHADEVRATYLNHTHDDIYELREEYRTQRQIEQAFEGKTTMKDIMLRDGLYALVSNVLFVRDRNDHNKFHPRITAQFNFIYEALYDSDKAVFNRIYNDYYYRRNNQYWYREAMKKLPLLVQATRMLVCAEDLGMVPDCVSWVMNELRILSLEIQSMPKDPSVRFGHLQRNPYRSVTTISTHDMSTLRQWWDEDEERTQRYFSSMLYRGGGAPHPLPGWLARDIILRHLQSPSMLCVLSIQDWLAMDEKLRLPDMDAERINIPANPKHYWRYRMHLNIESLMANDDLKANIRELIEQSGR